MAGQHLTLSHNGSSKRPNPLASTHLCRPPMPAMITPSWLSPPEQTHTHVTAAHHQHHRATPPPRPPHTTRARVSEYTGRTRGPLTDIIEVPGKPVAEVVDGGLTTATDTLVAVTTHASTAYPVTGPTTQPLVSHANGATHVPTPVITPMTVGVNANRTTPAT